MNRNTKRRGRGEGSITRRKDGRWQGAVSHYDAYGKRVRRCVYGATKAEVIAKLADRESMQPSAAGSLTVPQYLIQWLAAKAGTVAAATHERYTFTVQGQLLPHLPDKRLADFSPLDVARLYAALRESDESSDAQHKAAVALSVALNAAKRMRLIPASPAEGVPKPKLVKPERRTWTVAEARQFLAAASEDRYAPAYLLALHTGLRRGEIFGLHWGDLDFPAGTLTVRRQLRETKRGPRTAEPKTKSSRRTIQLAAHMLTSLHEHRKHAVREGRGGADDPVFTDARGGFVRKGNFDRRHFAPLLSAAGVPVITFHDLRHTMATLLLAEGVNIKVIQERLGHASANITLATYSHVMPGMQGEASEKMGRLLGAG